MLVAGELQGISESSSLGFLPWSVVLDLDPESETNGLYAAAARVLSQRRSLSWFGKELLPVNFQRGTAWMMANGWPSRKEDIPFFPCDYPTISHRDTRPIGVHSSRNQYPAECS
jgi:hypothetical protein